MPSDLHHAPTFHTLSEKLLAFNEALTLTVKDAYAIPKITKRILKWAGNDLELTQIICDYALQQADEFNDGNAETLLDHIVETQIVRQWPRSQAASHLQAIERVLLDSDRKDLLLLCYLKILQRGSVAINDDRPEQNMLVRSGLVTRIDRRLAVSNPLYIQIFNLDWIEQQLPGITRPVTIIGPGSDRKNSLQKRTEQQQDREQSAHSRETGKVTKTALVKPRQLESIPESRRPSAASGFYSRLAVLACCVAVAGGAISAYRYETANRTLVTQPSQSSVRSFQAASANDVMLSEETPTEAQENTSGERSAEITSKNSLSLPDVSNRIRFDQGVEHATNSRWLPMVREFCQLPAESTYYTTAGRQLESWARLYREDIQIAEDTFVQEEGGPCEIVANALE